MKTVSIKLLFFLILLFLVTCILPLLSLRLSAQHANCNGHDHAKEEKKLLPSPILKQPTLLPTSKNLILHNPALLKPKEHDHSTCGGHHEEKKSSGCSDNDGHDHSKHAAKEDDHSGHDHSKHAEGGCNGGDDAGLVEVTPEQKKEINLTLAKAGSGNLYKELTVPGEVVLNEDTVVHLVARVPGIALQVKKSLGDRIKKGEVMAVLDSAELGEAKSEYYERFNDVGCCKIDLDRAITIEKNTKKAINDLLKLPTLAELKKNNYGDMGKYRSELLATYSTFLTSKKDYERIKKLRAKQVVSESEYLQEQNEYDKAQADFFAKLHEAQFKIKQDLADKEQQQRVAEFKLKTAERKLLIFGLTKEQILKLQQTTSPLTTKTDCTDPNCKDCKTPSPIAKTDDIDLGFSKYIIKAPQDGVVTEKHLTTGEKIDDETEVFTVADLSKVWINLKVAARDIPFIKEGMPVTVSSSSGLTTQAQIALIAPTVDQETRTVIARIVIDNPNNNWKPGMFVTGHIRIVGANAGIALPTEAVQNIDGENVVFIPSGHGYKPVPVVIGKRDRRFVQILSGIKAGDTYVNKGAFELKAIQITSGRDPHAGHNH